MSEKTYLVTAYDENGVTLGQQLFSRFLTVYIPRSSIASVQKRLGMTYVETNGGHVYRIAPGFRKAQRKLGEEAFAS